MSEWKRPVPQADDESREFYEGARRHEQDGIQRQRALRCQHGFDVTTMDRVERATEKANAASARDQPHRGASTMPFLIGRLPRLAGTAPRRGSGRP